MTPPAISTSAKPNPLRVGWSVLWARRVRRPRPDPTATRRVDHASLTGVLDALRSEGVAVLSHFVSRLDDYRRMLEAIDPDALQPAEALAYWLNLYNAGALRLVGIARREGLDSVLRLPGSLGAPHATVAGETLSLEDVEHGKIRRFRDPRIHGALVCGSASCPTLRYEPFTGAELDRQLDDQLATFLARGGAAADEGRRQVRLSRVFLWYGGDFTRPSRMPTLLPARPRHVLLALVPWLPPPARALAADPRVRVEFMGYDWGLACAVG